MSNGLPPMPGVAPAIAMPEIPAPEFIPAGTPAPAASAAQPVVQAESSGVPATPPPTEIPSMTPNMGLPQGIPAAPAVAPAVAQIPAAPAVAPAPSTLPPLAIPTVQAAAIPAGTPAAQALVAAPASTPVAQALITLGPDGFPQGGTMAQVFEALGFEGISTDVFGIMPIITLTQGEFMKDKVLIDQEFYVQILSSRPKYLYSYGTPEVKNSPSGLFYTYDKAHNANNEDETLDQFSQLATSAGFQVKMTEYYEIDATLLANNEAVKLSVPKRGSGTQFVKFLTQCAAARRRPQDAVVKVKRGEKVTNVTHPYYPWAFEIAQWR